MNALTLNERIKLQLREDGYGSSGETVKAERTVYACVQKPGLSFQTRSESAGRKTDLTAHIKRSDFDRESYTHAVIGGISYRINGSGASVNDLMVKLSMELDG